MAVAPGGAEEALELAMEALQEAASENRQGPFFFFFFKVFFSYGVKLFDIVFEITFFFLMFLLRWYFDGSSIWLPLFSFPMGFCVFFYFFWFFRCFD